MRLFLILVGGIVVTGCTSVGTFSTVDLLGTTEFYSADAAHSVSELATTRVTIGPAAPSHDAGERPVFVLLVENFGADAFDVAPENVSVTTNEGQVVATISAEQLQEEARRLAMWLAIGAGMEAAGNSMQASNSGYQSGVANYSGTTNVYGAGGYSTANTFGTATYSGYNAGAAAQARAAADVQNDILMAQTSDRIDTIMSGAEYGAFHRQTVFPGNRYASRMTIDKLPRNTGGITVKFDAGGEIHTFAWSYSVE